jgi:hypothetical protein
MDDYVWYTRKAAPQSDELKELLLDGWEPFTASGVDNLIILRKLVTREDFELIWLQDRDLPKANDPIFDPWLMKTNTSGM